MEVDRAQELGERKGVGGRERSDEHQDLLGVVLVAPIAGQRGEPEESERGEAVGRRRRVVEQVLRAGDELLTVDAGGEHAAFLRIPEEVEHRVGRRDGFGDPPTLARGLGEGDERLHERRVVGRVSEVASTAVALPRTEPSAVVAAQAADQELAVRDRGVEPLAVLRRGGCLRERVEHERVPLGQHLVVETGPYPLLARVEQLLARLFDLGRTDEVTAHGSVQDVRAFEVAGLGHAVPLDGGGRELGAEHGFDVLDPPDVEATLLALGVGVLGRREAALGLPQVAEHVGDRLVEHLPPALLAELQPGVEVHPSEQGLVVEHLLEVRHHPERVDRVARESAPEVVVHPARRHRIERGLHDGASAVAAVVRVGAQAQLERHRLRELRRSAEPTPLGIELRADLLQRGVEHVGAGQRLPLGSRELRHAAQ